jgi:DNA-binding MarR family transcriptional regulator
VLNEQNVEDLAVRRQRFVDDLGRFFSGYGLNPTLGRILAHLMLSSEPASLDEIARDLGMSKSGASTAARILETWGMARRTTQPGSRRVLVEAADRGEALLEFGLPQVREFVRTLREGADVAPPGAAAKRVESLAHTFDLYLEAIQAILERIREEQRQ